MVLKAFGAARTGAVVLLLVFLVIPEGVFAAIPDGVEEQSIRHHFSGIHFTTNVIQPFPDSSMNAFPNGKDLAQVNIEAIRSDGTFAENFPIIVEKPSAISVYGPTSTCSGSFQLFFSSRTPIRARVTVKLRDYPQTNTSFTLNFIPRFNVTNRTDTNSFIINQPITFTAQIDPVEVRGLKVAKLRFVSIASFFLLGSSKHSEVVKDLKCSADGLCSAKVESASSNILLARRRTFNYKFFFVDQQNNKFSRSFTGTFTLP